MLKATFLKDDISRGNLCSRIAITLHVHDVALFSKNNFPVLKFLARYRVCTCIYTYIYVYMYAYRCIFPLNPTYLPRASAFHEFHRGFYFFQSSILSYVSCHFAFNFFSRLSLEYFSSILSKIQSFPMRNLNESVTKLSLSLRFIICRLNIFLYNKSCHLLFIS